MKQMLNCGYALGQTTLLCYLQVLSWTKRVENLSLFRCDGNDLLFPFSLLQVGTNAMVVTVPTLNTCWSLGIRKEQVTLQYRRREEKECFEMRGSDNCNGNGIAFIERIFYKYIFKCTLQHFFLPDCLMAQFTMLM